MDMNDCRPGTKMEATTSRQAELPACFYAMEEALNMLSESINILEEKLGPVMRSDPPEVAKSIAPIDAAGMGTEFGSRLDGSTREVRRMTSRLMELHGRLET